MCQALRRKWGPTMNICLCAQEVHRLIQFLSILFYNNIPLQNSLLGKQPEMETQMPIWMEPAVNLKGVKCAR